MKLAGKLIVAMLPLVFTHVVRTWFSDDHEKERRTVKKKTTKKTKTRHGLDGHRRAKNLPNIVTPLRRKNPGRTSSSAAL
jgi:hypothetical protein